MVSSSGLFLRTATVFGKSVWSRSQVNQVGINLAQVRGFRELTIRAFSIRFSLHEHSHLPLGGAKSTKVATLTDNRLKDMANLL